MVDGKSLPEKLSHETIYMTATFTQPTQNTTKALDQRLKLYSNTLHLMDKEITKDTMENWGKISVTQMAKATASSQLHKLLELAEKVAAKLDKGRGANARAEKTTLAKVSAYATIFHMTQKNTPTPSSVTTKTPTTTATREATLMALNSGNSSSTRRTL